MSEAVSPGIEMRSTQIWFVSTCTMPSSAMTPPQTATRQIRVSRRDRSRTPSCATSRVPAQDASASRATSAGLISSELIGPDIAST
ncbi:hypothetical protein [Jiangella alkaliphila]|uniref:hypothetical protein n=1 Tax=Jiangella alkaliphila TaxID=419479 RepID=UPI001E60D738|nr:hypothetical protein [Jiangella alkaliphila]